MPAINIARKPGAAPSVRSRKAVRKATAMCVYPGCERREERIGLCGVHRDYQKLKFQEFLDVGMELAEMMSSPRMPRFQTADDGDEFANEAVRFLNRAATDWNSKYAWWDVKPPVAARCK